MRWRCARPTARRISRISKASDGAIVLAGPFLDEVGGMCGSLLVYEGEREGAEAWAAADPYAQAGLFQSVEIRAWKKVVG